MLTSGSVAARGLSGSGLKLGTLDGETDRETGEDGDGSESRFAAATS